MRVACRSWYSLHVLRLIRRHVSTCKHTSTKYRRCSCPIHVYGSLRGEKIRKALDLTSWDAASELIASWTSSGEIGLARPEVPTIKVAVEKFIEYAKTRKRSWETVRKYENLLERRLLTWCEKKHYSQLKQLTVDSLRSFQASWDDGPNYAAKNVERLRAFLRFCRQADWIKTNPALALDAPDEKPAPTLPFSAQEMEKILAACESYRGDKNRIRAFILVMRYSGLRIGDAIALRRDRVQDGKLLLYTQKTGTPVYVPLPKTVTESLDSFESKGEHYFWSGKNRRSAVANWSRYLASVFSTADVSNAHSHRFRDTFAVSLLEKGVSLENLSVLLGHSSIRITEQHYRPWVKTLQAQLEQEVSRAWSLEPPGKSVTKKRRSASRPAA